MPTKTLLIALLAFAMMEPTTAAVHRWVMHGPGNKLHRSHHRARAGGGWERNDWFPVIFAAIAMTTFWFGFNRPDLDSLIPAGIGVTLYGATYALVHDLYIHRRLPLFGDRRLALFDRLAEAHRIHHLYGLAPYGMLVPLVPSALFEQQQVPPPEPLVPAES